VPVAALAADSNQGPVDTTTNAVKNGADATGHAIKEGAETTGHAIKEGAEATGHAVKEGAQATGHAVKQGAEATGEFLGLTASDRERYEANERGERETTGKVKELDHTNGRLTLATTTGTLALHFPPADVHDLAKGDRIRVTLAFAPAQAGNAAAAEGKSEEHAEAAKEEGDHWMTGTVTKVDSANGTVHVKTAEAPLKLRFQPDAVRNLKDGDQIAVELAYEPVPSSKKM
jgi:hypothetical protein